MTATSVSANKTIFKSGEFILIPPGTFMMGCSPGDEECHPEEKPAHRVAITRAFEIARCQVTQAQYEAVMGSNPSYFPGPDQPVEGVSWDDAQKFCEALNTKQDGYRYRLPTEAEWEYAARAGNTSCRYGVLQEAAWYHENAGDKTHPVGLKEPNAFGLHDTLGNVWEWVQDRYGADYYSLSPESDPTGPSTGEMRVARGGSWRGVARGLARVSSRYANKSSLHSIVIGFRLVREPVEKSSPGR
ncbi:MAG TPA: formylglycine-generating enzyme family protein [Alphaproteobacteria bacterium]|nr:formylglycine-generating enzyme family protein [Alphaproteobacteria bacterium]